MTNKLASTENKSNPHQQTDQKQTKKYRINIPKNDDDENDHLEVKSHKTGKENKQEHQSTGKNLLSSKKESLESIKKHQSEKKKIT